MIGSKFGEGMIRTTNCILWVMALLLQSLSAEASVLNVDINASTGDYVHVGSDGVLSTEGTYWNAYARRDPITMTGLRDESNTVTSVSIGRSGYPGWFYYNALPTNNLQFSAIESSQSYQSDYLYISNLTSTAEYDVAVYLSVLPTKLWVNGTWKTSEVGDVTGTLPGTEDYDYILFTNVSPYAGGSISIYIGRTTLGSYNAVVSGIQVRGPMDAAAPDPPPAFDSVIIGDTDAVLEWSSLANHQYTLHDSTNLSIGFSELQPGIPATPPMNIYTVSPNAVRARFWKITTEE